MKSYEKPQIEAIEIEIEGAILAVSGMGEGEGI